jgi:hypothetical protein
VWSDGRRVCYWASLPQSREISLESTFTKRKNKNVLPADWCKIVSKDDQTLRSENGYSWMLSGSGIDLGPTN